MRTGSPAPRYLAVPVMFVVSGLDQLITVVGQQETFERLLGNMNQIQGG
ncbi:unnamed protein product [Penicillium camemberti]|uniref:Str. FM013 n=1 Tax=Penicillium camemberti (strain FM 013) TaxID=1429867 RepID=A0A0G4PAX0_PENC3|nr:unnamed protein product [Penicillium camemberti]